MVYSSKLNTVVDYFMRYSHFTEINYLNAKAKTNYVQINKHWCVHKYSDWCRQIIYFGLGRLVNT